MSLNATAAASALFVAFTSVACASSSVCDDARTSPLLATTNAMTRKSTTTSTPLITLNTPLNCVVENPMTLDLKSKHAHLGIAICVYNVESERKFHVKRCNIHSGTQANIRNAYRE